ncbi:sensor histidine kinase [Luteimicrobium sp. NPDC057192]|uniref:sensor histidine kinase n=1 Tax=Luteimicrobium sp. NPDC057192 TaxID=3346042 RepID=UPI00363D34D5
MTHPAPPVHGPAPVAPRRRPGRRAPGPWLDIAVAVASFALFTLPVVLSPPSDAHPLATPLLGLLVAAPLAWARRAPTVALALVSAGLVAAALTGVRVTPFVSDLGPALGVAAYACATRLPRRTALIAVGAAAAVVSATDLVALHLWPDRDQDLVQLLIAGAGWFIGDVVRARRGFAEALAAEEERLAREADARIRAEERLRVSRDVHDVVSHALSLVAVRSGVGRVLLDDDPEQARAALATIEEVSRRALTELRAVLAGLRDVGDTAPGTAEPTLDDVPALVASVGEAGVDAELRVAGDAGYDRLLETSAYRVVQEALTNAVKHAPGARVRVTLQRVRPLVVVVENTSPTDRTGEPLTGSGSGLDGIRARVELHGGHADAGPDDRGGWRVRAVFGPDVPAELTEAPHTGARAGQQRRPDA